MASWILFVFAFPLLVSILLIFSSRPVQKILVIGSGVLLSVASVVLFFMGKQGTFVLQTPDWLNTVILFLDFALLAFFFVAAAKQRSILGYTLAALQIILLIWIVMNLPHGGQAAFVIDKLSLFMFILINVVSSVIAIFSLQYIYKEECSPARKRYFLSTIFWFMACMNMIVASDNMEYFYFFFEMTTLASYLLIRFRLDAESRNNALTALWMNQVGGVAILVAIIFILIIPGYGQPYFTNLLAAFPQVQVILPFAFLAIAALVKGAQYPFNKWLIGAMVAPTPVSALLHSSTMVKIAPFLILKISPALSGSSVALVIILLTAFVFISAALGALAQDNFKKILAHSTIALLALMILMGAVGSQTAIVAALILMLFHGLSKALLFLNAGVLEQVFHFKETSKMNGLGETGPFTAMVIALGFMSLLLPPFGAFIGKWFSIETLGMMAGNSKLAGALVLVAIACGGAILSLLYFKVMGAVISRRGHRDEVLFEKYSTLYKTPLLVLLAAVFICTVFLPLLLTGYILPVAGSVLANPVNWQFSGWTLALAEIKLPLVPMIAAGLLLPLGIITAFYISFGKVDRAREYTCGEKIEYNFSSFYFSSSKADRWILWIALAFFLALIVIGFLPFA